MTDITKQCISGYFMQRRIVCAANKYLLTNGEELILPCVRHGSPDLHKTLKMLVVAGLLKKGWCFPHNQGFIDQYSNWWSRTDARIIAEAANQINYERNGHDTELFSEGLY